MNLSLGGVAYSELDRKHKQSLILSFVLLLVSCLCVAIGELINDVGFLVAGFVAATLSFILITSESQEIRLSRIEKMIGDSHEN